MKAPKVYIHKTLKYKGKVVFSKLVMSEFKRIDKHFQENEACFMFVNEGDFTLRTPNKIITIEPQEAFVAKCGNYFFEMNCFNPNSERQIAFVAAYFYPEIVRELFDENIFNSTVQSKYDVNKFQIDTMMRNFIDTVDFMLDNKDAVDDELILTKLKEFLLLLSKTGNSPSLSEYISSLFTPHEYAFKSIISKHQHSNLSLSEMAFLCGISLSTFKRKFFEIYSESPRKYLSKVKIEKAKKLLSIAENRISDIAYECGFESVSTFNRNFKKHVEISATDFRKKIVN